jgi:hypothetical protein
MRITELLIAFLLGVAFGQWWAVPSVNAECCGMFDVPFNTQLEIERQETWAQDQADWDRQRHSTRSLFEPCAR